MDAASRPSPLPTPPAWPSWLISVCLHGLLVLALGVVWQRGVPANAEPEAVTREFGILLRDQGPEVPDPTAPPSETPAIAALADAQRLIDALPSQPAARFRPQDFLPGASAAPPLGTEQSAAAAALTGGGPSRVAIPTGHGRVEVFGTEGIGSKFAFVFDRSVSMEGPPLAAAKFQLHRAIEALQSTHQFQVVFFNHLPHVPDLTSGQRRIPMATEPNKRSAFRFIDRVTAEGGTDRYPSLMRAIHLRPDVIYFLTDADDPMSPDEVAEVGRRNRGLATLHTIEFGRGERARRENFLVRLAAKNGGKYVYVDVTQWGS